MRLDRNGIPILDPPKEANKLSKECDHFFVQTSKKFHSQDFMMDLDYYKVESRCRYCGQLNTRIKSHEDC